MTVARGLWWLPAVAWYGVISWFSHQPEWPELATGWPDWVLHGTAYAVLGGFLWLGLAGGARGALGAGRLAGGLAIALLAATLDEVHQGFIPTRQATLSDVAADLAGAFVGLAAAEFAAFAGLLGLWEDRER